MLTKNEVVRFEELHTLMKTEEDLLKSAMDNSKEIAHMAMVANKNSLPNFNNPSNAQFNGNRGQGRNQIRGRGSEIFQNYNNRGVFNQGNSNNGGATDHFTLDLNNIPDNQAYTDSQLVSVGNGKPFYKGFSKDGLYPITGLTLPSWNSCVSNYLFRSSHALPSSQSASHVSYTTNLSTARSNISHTYLSHMRLSHP
uniref:Uncharacterized protein n=1 Tax=Fagus sylvatica TaxID=28930 RepID=A0A2N9I1T4_FAGSY